MTVITSDIARGRPRTCPVCGTPNHTCGASSASSRVVVHPRDTRRRTGRMELVDAVVNGVATKIRVPVYAKEDDGETKKRPPAKDKKIRAPEENEKQDDGRPIPKIRTK